jgi:hypothetical protein
MPTFVSASERNSMLDQTLRMHDVVDVLNAGVWKRGKIKGFASHQLSANFPTAVTVIDSYDVQLDGLVRFTATVDDVIRLVGRARK